MTHAPPEILELIIDELAVSGWGPWKGLLGDLKAACLAARSFVPHCQKHIFRAIDMHPSRRIVDIRVPSTTELFSNLISSQESGHLAGYVKKLVYKADATVDFKNPNVITALAKMTAVEDFRCSTPKLKSLRLRGLAVDASDLAMARGVKSESVLKIPEELSDLCLDIISDDYGRNVRIFPLDYLNQKSFSTLSRLELKITFTIERDEDPVLDPYLGFCKTTVVRHLTSLTHLKFDIRFQGSPSTVDLLSTGPEWGRYPEDISQWDPEWTELTEEAELYE
ncbi:hypothetical protein D9611_006134 [Ephemerocybe angulata]|uniref:Uncharacterized protein n=1 Tax=Ephemerocybe angulata TaxID=980116 RepID=A0A8H5FLS0_9AGAR|nr:hypothetical protein D9611_006134 [Tulosesus angulatus]